MRTRIGVRVRIILLVWGARRRWLVVIHSASRLWIAVFVNVHNDVRGIDSHNFDISDDPHINAITLCMLMM